MRTRPTSQLIALCSAGSVGGIALAACAFALPEIAADATTIELQYVPAGAFTPVDGRAMVVDAWRIDADIAAAVVADFDSRRTPPVLDYEHQTLRKEQNGQPAPAAGWFRSLAWREGKGLYATVELTPRARDYIRSGEYRYFSPVFAYDIQSGEITQVLMGALTNNPAIHGMEPLTLQAAATFGAAAAQSPQEKSEMNKLLTAVIAALCMSAAVTEDQAIAALTAVKPELDNLRKALGIAADAKPEAVVAGIAAATAQVDQLTKMREALNIPADAKPETAIAACTALSKTATGNGATPNPAEFVPVAVVKDLQTQVAALTAGTVDRQVNEIVDKALSTGHLLPAQKDWATSLGKSNLAALTSYIDSAQPIAALTGTQTQGRRPVAGDNAHGLTHDEIAVCSATGIDPKAFAAAKPKAA